MQKMNRATARLRCLRGVLLTRHSSSASLESYLMVYLVLLTIETCHNAWWFKSSDVASVYSVQKPHLSSSFLLLKLFCLLCRGLATEGLCIGLVFFTCFKHCHTCILTVGSMFRLINSLHVKCIHHCSHIHTTSACGEIQPFKGQLVVKLWLNNNCSVQGFSEWLTEHFSSCGMFRFNSVMLLHCTFPLYKVRISNRCSWKRLFVSIFASPSLTLAAGRVHYRCVFMCVCQQPISHCVPCCQPDCAR